MVSFLPTVDIGAIAASVVAPITNYINNGLTTVENLVAGVASTISNDIKATISNVGDAVGHAEVAIASDVKTSVLAVEGGVTSALSGVARTVGQALNEVETALAHVLTTLGADIEQGFVAVSGPVEHIATAIVTDIGSGLSSIERELGDFAHGVEEIAVAVGGELAKIPSVLMQLVEAPGTIASALATTAYNESGSFLKGLQDGHHTSVGWLMALAKAPADARF